MIDGPYCIVFDGLVRTTKRSRRPIGFAEACHRRHTYERRQQQQDLHVEHFQRPNVRAQTCLLVWIVRTVRSEPIVYDEAIALLQ